MLSFLEFYWYLYYAALVYLGRPASLTSPYKPLLSLPSSLPTIHNIPDGILVFSVIRCRPYIVRAY